MPNSRKDRRDRDIFWTLCPKLNIKTFGLYKSQTAGCPSQVANGGQSPGEPFHLPSMVYRGLGAAQSDLIGDSELCHGYTVSRIHNALFCVDMCSKSQFPDWHSMSGVYWEVFRSQESRPWRRQCPPPPPPRQSPFPSHLHFFIVIT